MFDGGGGQPGDGVCQVDYRATAAARFYPLSFGRTQRGLFRVRASDVFGVFLRLGVCLAVREGTQSRVGGFENGGIRQALAG